MKKIFKSIKDNFAVFIVIAILCIASSALICENDLFFDIKTGEDILKNGFTFNDHFSWIPGLKYIYLHWFYDIFIYSIYNIWNFIGLYCFFTIISIIFFSIFYIEIYKISLNKIVALLITIFTFYTCCYAFVSRVQSIIYILLFTEVIFLEKLYKYGEKKYSIYLILLSILVVNLQMPIWIFYFILCLPFVLEFFLSFLNNKIKIFNCLTLNSPKNKKIFILTIFIILFSGFISPLTYNAYTFFLKSLGNSIYNQIGITEMMPTIILYTKS